MSYTVKRLVISNQHVIQENDYIEINYTINGVSKQLKTYCRSAFNKTSSDFLTPQNDEEIDAWSYILVDKLPSKFIFLDENLDFEIKGVQTVISFATQLTARSTNLTIDSFSSSNPDLIFDLKSIIVDSYVNKINLESINNYHALLVDKNNNIKGITLPVYGEFSVHKYINNLHVHPKYESKIFSNFQRDGKTIIDFNYTGYPKYKVKYSLDGVAYQDENTFNLSTGKHTIYIKNQIDQVIEKEIEVFDYQGKKAVNPFVFVSKINPIRYAQIVNHDNKTIFKTDENTLSCNDVDELNHLGVQLWQTQDNPTTQLKTNFSNITVKAFNKNNSFNLDAKRVRKYTNVFDLRTANIFNINDKFGGIYFKKGKIFNPENNQFKEDYNQGGAVPIFYKYGTWLEVVGKGYVKLVKVIFDADKKAEVLVFQSDFNINDEEVILRYNYDVQPFDVWEFETPMAFFENENFRISTTITDDRFNDATFLSEIQNVKEVQKDCFELVYYEKDNGEFLYETGIKNKLRLKVEKQTDTPQGETNIHITDTNVVLKTSSYYEGKLFVFSFLTSEIAKTLELALIHYYLFINGVAYKSKEPPKKAQQGNTNLYQVTATLLKADSAHIFGDKQQIIDPEFEDIDIDVPGLINNGEGGFIKY